MKASVRWLREICPNIPDDPATIAARFTAAGIEVEGVHAFGLAAEASLVATVVSSRPHPSRSGLRLVTVDRGDARPEVVCGAPNVPEPGGLVVLAPLGAHLPAKGITIERRAIAGVDSEGMLCSEEELGLGDDGAGILVLPPGTAAPGTPLARALPAARDTVLELGLTPNRADGLGHIGLAREAAALFDVPFGAPEVPPPRRTLDEKLQAHASVAIDDAERCPHYGAGVLVGAKIGLSPLAVRWRLSALGLRPISNVVDVTNWVMLEYGHPMHAFDLDRVRGHRIVVRRAREGEPLVTLDGVARALSTDDLVIADAEGALALAGVIGGEGSGIGAQTSRVLLECAYFEPRGVRRAARRHGVHTDASHRFERGVDPGDTRAALARASGLIAELAGATAVREQVVFEARPLPRRTVALRQERVEALLGVEVPAAEGAAILERLGFTRRSAQPAQQPGATAWLVPTHRADVAREVDLIEEIARVRGYDAIPTERPAILPSRDRGPRQAILRRVRQAAVAEGLLEAITFAFVSPRDLEAAGAPRAGVVLRNPLREEQSVMRTSLLPGLLQAVAHARRHGERDARVFSAGPVFAQAGQTAARARDAQPPREPLERLAFAAVLAGDRSTWLSRPQPVDVWDAKGLAEGLLRRLLRRAPGILRAAEGERPRHLHPRGAAWIEVEGKRVGALGPLHPETAEAFDVGEGVLAVELDLEELFAVGPLPITFSALPRFPASLRDIAVVVPDAVTAGEVARAVREAAGDLAERVAIFDRFAGGAIPAGHTSLGLRVVYRAADRTLTDAEVDARHTKVVTQIEKQFGGQLRV